MIIAIEDAEAGMILESNVVSSNRVKLLPVGTMLSSEMIEVLKKKGVSKLHVTENRKYHVELKTYAREYFKRKQSITATMAEVADEKIMNKVMEILHFIRKLPYIENLLIDLKGVNSYVFEHSFNVMILAMIVAEKLRWSKDDIIEAGIAGLLHNIGTIELSEELLNKKGKLTTAEVEEMKKHTIFGYEKLNQESQLPKSTGLAALLHHENLDGTGYPFGLKQEKIHPVAQLIAVVDKYDAIISKRPYRNKHISHDEALEILYKMGYREINGDMVAAFRGTLTFYPVDAKIVLNNGDIASVKSINKSFATRPSVMVYGNINGEMYKQPFLLNLNQDLTIQITGYLDQHQETETSTEEISENNDAQN